MKKNMMILSMLFIMVLSGCDVMQDTHLDASYPRYEDYRVSETSMTNFNVTESNYQRIASDWSIQYATDQEMHNVYDYFQTPEETLSSRKGDCEDLAILQMVLHYQFTGEKGELLFLLYNDGSTKGHTIFSMIHNGVREYVRGVGAYGKFNWGLVSYHMEKNDSHIYKVFNYSQSLYLAYEVKSPKFYH